MVGVVRVSHFVFTVTAFDVRRNFPLARMQMSQCFSSADRVFDSVEALETKDQTRDASRVSLL